MSRPAATAAIVGVTIAIVRLWLGRLLPDGDFGGAMIVALNILAGRDVYSRLPQMFSVPYPVTAGIFALPFIPVGIELFVAGSFAVMSAAIVQQTGQPWRLMMMFSAPSVAALKFAQWSPLIVAAWYIPILAPTLAIIKPQIALPVALNRISRPGLLVAGCLLLVSLVICPTWPLKWLAMSRGYEYFIPILTPGGFLLALAALKWRDERARLLLGTAVLPARGMYDLLPLFICPQHWGEMVMAVIASWLVPFNFIYLMALAFVLRGRFSDWARRAMATSLACGRR